MRKVLVIFGGVSPEHEVSLMSCASLLKNIDRTKNEIIELGITKDGRFLYTNADAQSVKSGNWVNEENYPAFISTDRTDRALYVKKDGGFERKEFDLAFPMLHGENGEDGRLQGLLELADIPFVGPGAAASANSMDKSLTKVVLERAGIPQARYLVFLRAKYDKDAAAKAVEEKFTYPVFVKPASTGSSCGVSKVTDRNELWKAMDYAFRFDRKLLVEEYIAGKEVEVAVLGDTPTFASVCGQIAPSAEFYDYEAKYNDPDSKLYIPAHIDEKQSEAIRQTAIKVFETLECKGHSRVDFFALDDGSFLLNEINTLPGFTDISMFPKLMMFTKGINYAELLEIMMEIAERDAK